MEPGPRGMEVAAVLTLTPFQCPERECWRCQRSPHAPGARTRVDRGRLRRGVAAADIPAGACPGLAVTAMATCLMAGEPRASSRNHFPSCPASFRKRPFTCFADVYHIGLSECRVTCGSVEVAYVFWIRDPQQMYDREPPPLSIACSESVFFTIMPFKGRNFKTWMKSIFYSCFLFRVFIFII